MMAYKGVLAHAGQLRVDDVALRGRGTVDASFSLVVFSIRGLGGFLTAWIAAAMLVGV